MKTIGILKEVLEVQSGTSKAGKDWQKQEFVIDTGDQFNPIMCFGAFGEDKVNKLKEFKVGDSIEIEFNVQCREFKGKYYTNLDAWKIDKAATDAMPTPASDTDDLPF